MEQTKYSCINCSFNTNYKQRYNRHLLTNKHKISYEPTDPLEQIKEIYTCNCTKQYKSYVGLWKHKQKCHSQTVCQVISDTATIDKKMEELKSLIIELKDNQQPITTTTNNTNNNNNININLILNENFKNAKNFIDMIREMKLDDIYHDNISSVDYVSDVFRMIKTEMDKLPFVERPIQCIKNEDDHQKILHIRHENEWRKETELEWQWKTI